MAGADHGLKVKNVSKRIAIGPGAEAGTGVVEVMNFGVTAAQAEKGDEEEAKRGLTVTGGVEAEVEAILSGPSIIGGRSVTQRIEMRRERVEMGRLGTRISTTTVKGTLLLSIEMRRVGGEPAAGSGNAEGVPEQTLSVQQVIRTCLVLRPLGLLPPAPPHLMQRTMKNWQGKKGSLKKLML